MDCTLSVQDLKLSHPSSALDVPAHATAASWGLMGKHDHLLKLALRLICSSKEAPHVLFRVLLLCLGHATNTKETGAPHSCAVPGSRFSHRPGKHAKHTPAIQGRLSS